MRRVRSLIAVLACLLALGLLFVAPVGAQEGDTLEVTLDEVDGSGISGVAILTEEEDGVLVEIEVSGDGVVGDHPVHIHRGTCDNLDPAPEYPLPSIDEDGLSSEVVEGITLAELTESDYAINAHKSAEEIGVYVACGNILASGESVGGTDTTTDTTTTTTTAPSTAPSTGVGSAFGGEDNSLLLALAALAGVLAVAGVALRVREARA
jgi:hypothetical protein